MKKAAFVLVLLVLVLFLTGCRNRDSSGLVEIRDNMYITQIEEINLNYRDYLGRTIKIAGLFRHNFWENNHWFYVVRNVPDCCGEGGVLGFEVTWDPDFQGTNHDVDLSLWPERDTWVEAVGELGHYEFFGNKLFLVLSELNVLEGRRLVFVHR